MTPLHYDNLGSSLIEICNALKTHQKGKSLSLYAVGLSQVYYQENWMGKGMKVWDKSWIWLSLKTVSPSIEEALKFILNIDFNDAARKAMLLRQQKIWNYMRQIDLIDVNNKAGREEAQRLRYVKYLENEFAGSYQYYILYPVYFDERRTTLWSEEEEKFHQHSIVNFHQVTYDFWTLFIKNSEENKRLRACLIPYIDASSAELVDRVFFKILKKEGRWVNLEGIMQKPIPVTLFSKLNNPQSLNVEENRVLRDWVQTLNNCKKSVSPKLVWIVLSEVMDIIRLQGSSTVTLQDLLYWLEQQGCEILDQEDLAHTHWRRGLDYGKIIECNGKKLVLGNQLSSNKEIDDRNKIFELKDHPNYVVKISHNRFRLCIEAKQAQNPDEHWGFRYVEMIANINENNQDPSISGLDQHGRCVVLEKLTPAFDQWTSTSFILTPEDERVALVFANHIYCVSAWKGSPQNLSIPHLMWDHAGVLKSTRLLKKGPANYNEWENYCIQAAMNNPFILSFIMHVSKLVEHPVALFYREAVKNVLQTGEIRLIGLALPLGNRRDVYEQHAEIVCKEAQRVREYCIKYIRTKNYYSHKEDQLLQKDVSDKLLELYASMSTSGTLSSSMGQEVINSFDPSLSIDRKNILTVDSHEVKSFYKRNHDLMIQNNNGVLGGKVGVIKG